MAHIMAPSVGELPASLSMAHPLLSAPGQPTCPQWHCFIEQNCPKSPANYPKIKHRITIGNSTPRYVPQGIENRDKYFYTDAYSSKIHNSQKLETTPTSIRRRIDEHNMADPRNGTLLAINRKEALTPATTWVSPEGIMCSEGSHHQRPQII